MKVTKTRLNYTEHLTVSERTLKINTFEWTKTFAWKWDCAIFSKLEM